MHLLLEWHIILSGTVVLYSLLRFFYLDQTTFHFSLEATKSVLLAYLHLSYLVLNSPLTDFATYLILLHFFHHLPALGNETSQVRSRLGILKLVEALLRRALSSLFLLLLVLRTVAVLVLSIASHARGFVPLPACRLNIKEVFSTFSTCLAWSGSWTPCGTKTIG